MGSNFACLGLQFDSEAAFEAMIQSIVPRARSLGRRGNLHVLRWDDPGGARLVLRVMGREFVGLTPSFAGTPGTKLADIGRVNDEVWRVTVVDDDDEQVTAATVDLEEAGLIDGLREPREATIVALGHDIAVFESEAAFHASNASLIDPNAEPAEPPENAVKLGLQWPPRMSAESFMSIGVFGAPDDADTFARLNGTVLRSERRTTVETGLAFGVCRVRTLGMEVDLCLASEDHPELPSPGQVVGGIVYLTASVGVPPRRPSLIDRLRRRLS